jgi:transposase
MQDKAERRKLVLQVRRRWEFNKENLGEWDIRRFAASEATVIGYSGVSIVSEATGLSRNTIMRGINEINDKKYVVERQPGGGRLKSEDKQEGLLEALEKLLEWNTFGDPECSLQWTIKSLRTLAKELRKEGFTIGPSTVSRLLADLGYSLQSNKKALNGSQDENRDAQFKHINERIKDYRASGDIIISVDSKNKVYIGNFKNNGQTYSIKNDPVLVNDHDFHAPGDLKAIP